MYYATRLPRRQRVLSTRGRTFVIAVSCAVYCPEADIALAGPFDKTGVMWAPFVEWSQPNPSFTSNPFDLEATATFVHEATQESITTPMFYRGEETWSWRFAGTKTGRWTFTTSSSDAELDGLAGSVEIAPNPDPQIGGFMVGSHGKFARQTDESGALDPLALQVYMNMRRPDESNPGVGKSNSAGWTPIRNVETQAARDGFIQQAKQSGMNAVFFQFNAQWFDYDSIQGRADQLGSDDPNPDSRTFETLEHMIVDAHREGLQTVIWAWGDDARSWTPSTLLGGQNGEADLRLQSYIAARLGPIPGWSMGYGFDLEEWAGEDEVGAWAANINGQSGWQHMLWGRRRSGPDLDAVSNDRRPDGNPRDQFYTTAIAELQKSGDRPVIYERRFGYQRDDVWDDETMRHAMWQFTLAGGAAGWWGFRSGTGITAPGPFAEPELFRTHQTFWEDRLELEMTPHNELTGGDIAFALATDDYSSIVVYQEDTGEVQLNLSNLAHPADAVAVDAKAEYAEIPLGTLENLDFAWEAPYESDWAIALRTAIVETIPGDFDGDEDVDGADFISWQRGESPNPVSPNDLAEFVENFGAGVDSALVSAENIPEPSTWVGAIGATTAWVLRRKISPVRNAPCP